MKAMQTLKELDRSELDSKLKELRKEQFALRAQKSTGSLEKPASLSVLRRQIARVLTLISMNDTKSKSFKKKNKKMQKTSIQTEGGEQ